MLCLCSIPECFPLFFGFLFILGAYGRERKEHLRSVRCFPHGSDQVSFDDGDEWQVDWKGPC